MIKVYTIDGFNIVMTVSEFNKMDKSKVIRTHPWNFGDSPKDWIPTR